MEEVISEGMNIMERGIATFSSLWMSSIIDLLKLKTLMPHTFTFPSLKIVACHWLPEVVETVDQDSLSLKTRNYQQFTVPRNGGIRSHIYSTARTLLRATILHLEFWPRRTQFSEISPFLLAKPLRHEKFIFSSMFVKPYDIHIWSDL